MDEQMHARLRDEALDWSIRMHGPDVDAAVHADLAAWIARSDVHAAAWMKAEKTWALMNRVAPAHETAWEQAPRAAASPVAPRPPRSRKAAPLAASVAACLALWMAAPAIGIWARADHSTGKGEIRQVRLADGSTVDLDSGSAIRIDHMGARRGVTLLAGNAYFDVAHDASRPFTVHADDVDVRVLGTAFDVGIATDDVEVAVQRGAVRVSRDGIAPVDLRPGDVVRVGQGDAGATRSTIAPGRIAAWRDGQIIVNGATVAEVVAELRRYHPGLILLRNDDLARRQVTGAYDVGDPQAALRAIVHPYGGQLTTISRYVLILS